MPLVTLGVDTQAPASRGGKVNKLTLAHGEKALIVCIEDQPVAEYRHTIEAPVIADGRVLKEEKKRRDGSTYETPVMEFFGQHLCFGDFSVVNSKGIDAVGCPSCQAHKDGVGVALPQKYYALHVIKYSLQQDSFKLRDPFAVECLPWVLSQKRIDSLSEIADDLAADDVKLQARDLRLGPCTSAGYQQYEIHVSTRGEWLLTDERKATVKATYNNNKLEDLALAISKRITKAQALEDIEKVVERMEQIQNLGKVSPSAAVADLSKPSKPASDDPMDLFAPETPGEAAASEPFKAPAKSGETMDLDDLLKDL